MALSSTDLVKLDVIALGQLDLRDRARVERWFWACCETR